MGYEYCLFCRTCKTWFDLGKEGEFPYDTERMYCMKDFLLEHCDHDLTVGSWNNADSVIDHNEFNQWSFKEKGWKRFDDTFSKEDYQEERKREMEVSDFERRCITGDKKVRKIQLKEEFREHALKYWFTREESQIVKDRECVGEICAVRMNFGGEKYIFRSVPINMIEIVE